MSTPKPFRIVTPIFTARIAVAFVLSNWLMAGFVVALSTRNMVAATILISILVLFLIFVNLRLLIYYPAYWTQPFDYLFLHAPARLFLLVALDLLLPLSVFMAIGHDWHPPKDVIDYQWEGFAAVITAGILGTIIAGWRRDLIWSAGTVWLLWAIGALKPKTAPVMVRPPLALCQLRLFLSISDHYCRL